MTGRRLGRPPRKLRGTPFCPALYEVQKGPQWETLRRVLSRSLAEGLVKVWSKNSCIPYRILDPTGEVRVIV